MGKFLLRVIVNAFGIAITAQLVPGINVLNDDFGSLLIIGLVFGIVNALLRPLLLLLTCPAVILTLGLFILIINGVLLMVTASVLPDRLHIDSMWSAILGGIIMSIIGMIFESILNSNSKNNERDGTQTITIERR